MTDWFRLDANTSQLVFHTRCDSNLGWKERPASLFADREPGWLGDPGVGPIWFPAPELTSDFRQWLPERMAVTGERHLRFPTCAAVLPSVRVKGQD